MNHSVLQKQMQELVQKREKEKWLGWQGGKEILPGSKTGKFPVPLRTQNQSNIWQVPCSTMTEGMRIDHFFPRAFKKPFKASEMCNSARFCTLSTLGWEVLGYLEVEP